MSSSQDSAVPDVTATAAEITEDPTQLAAFISRAAKEVLEQLNESPTNAAAAVAAAAATLPVSDSVEPEASPAAAAPAAETASTCDKDDEMMPKERERPFMDHVPMVEPDVEDNLSPIVPVSLVSLESDDLDAASPQESAILGVQSVTELTDYEISESANGPRFDDYREDDEEDSELLEDDDDESDGYELDEEMGDDEMGEEDDDDEDGMSLDQRNIMMDDIQQITDGEEVMVESRPAGLFEEIWASVLQPGIPSRVVMVMDMCFYALFATLAMLFVGTSFNPHVAFLLFIAVCLFFSVKWFLVEVSKVQSPPSSGFVPGNTTPAEPIESTSAVEGKKNV